MQIKTIKVGALETNCYLIFDNNSFIVIDPGGDIDLILKELGELKMGKIILTHLHFDHIIAAGELKDKIGAEIFCSKKDLEILDEKILGKNDIDGFVEDGGTLFLTTYNLPLTAISTPGHTPGSICLYFPEQKIIFSGDTIFKGSVGATHFLGGNFSDLKHSIETKILTLPDDTFVYPGHGESFRLGDWKGGLEKIIK